MNLERSKMLAICITFILVMTVIPFTNIGISTGGYTTYANEPIEISTVEELQAMRDDLEADYVLVNDIDASVTREWNWNETEERYEGFEPVGKLYRENGDFLHEPFNGSFDGQGYEITGLYIDRPSDNDIGMFGYVGLVGEIRNIGVVDGYVSGRENVGILIGYNGGTLSNSYTTGDVCGLTYVGGLVGNNRGNWRDKFVAMISNSYSTAHTNGSSKIGGLVGSNWYGNITKSYSTGTVSGGDAVGGLVGSNIGSLINYSYAIGDVSGDEHVGGLVGINDWSVLNSYTTGNVRGNKRVGGLVGFNEGVVLNSHATGEVRGEKKVGGLIGDQQMFIAVRGSVDIGLMHYPEDLDTSKNDVNFWFIYNSFATGEVFGNDSIGGLVGRSKHFFIVDSYATGDVTGNNNVGGLIGVCISFSIENYHPISNTYARGDVTGKENVGGLIGHNWGTIEHSYSTGRVAGERNVGGLIGINREKHSFVIGPRRDYLGSVHHSFHDKEASELENAIGFDNGTAENVHSLSTTQMKSNETFIDAGWDFESTWSIDADRNDGYPYLQWQEFDEEESSTTLSLELILGIIVIIAATLFLLRRKLSSKED